MRRASLINIFSVVIIGISRAAPVRVGERLFWRAVICTVPLLFGAHRPTSSRGSWPSIRAPAVRPVSDVSRDLRPALRQSRTTGCSCRRRKIVWIAAVRCARMPSRPHAEANRHPGSAVARRSLPHLARLCSTRDDDNRLSRWASCCFGSTATQYLANYQSAY